MVQVSFLKRSSMMRDGCWACWPMMNHCEHWLVNFLRELLQGDLRAPYTGALSLPNGQLAGIRQRYPKHIICFFCRQWPSTIIQCACPYKSNTCFPDAEPAITSTVARLSDLLTQSLEIAGQITPLKSTFFFKGVIYKILLV